MEGFHATSKINADNIIEDGFIINKERKNDWLGHGIYLFQYKADARTWAENTYYTKTDPSIIKCCFEIEKEKYLDLDNPERLGEYYKYYEDLLDCLSKENQELNFKNSKEAMCWGLNIYKEDKKIDAIKFTFENTRTAKAKGYTQAIKGYTYKEIQICISKNDLILDKEIII